MYTPKPFIPSTLRLINTESARVVVDVHERERHCIDFHQYISSFAGSNFLPVQSINSSTPDLEHTPSSKMTLGASSYLRVFSVLLNNESTAKREEHETRALYKVPLHRITTRDGELWALSVPGLREDNPHIEMGNTLQLRQLCVDNAGHLMQMPVFMDIYQTSHLGSPPFKHACWTGVQHNISVASVNRALELVHFKAEGLQFLSIGPHVLPMQVNVTFPLKDSSLRAQRRALARADNVLKKIIASTTRDDRSHNFRLNDSTQSSATKCGLTEPPELFSRTLRNDWMRRMLFPIEDDGHLQSRLRKIPQRPFFDHAINYEQAHAINDACISDYGVLPYLISGPPGTGKTKTLVGMAMQLLNTTNVNHILICAPSDAAADTLTLRLKQYLSIKQLFRLNRPNRADNEVPKEILQHCYFEKDMFYLPPFHTLMGFNILVTSCRDANILTEARLTNNDLWTLERNMISTIHPERETPIPTLHWGALLLDEAAQATEMEILPAINVVVPPLAYPSHLAQPRFVMAGDENQLGPRTASRDSDFSTSLFARLLSRPLYKNHPLSRSNVKPASRPPVLKSSMLPIIFPPFSILIRNYRSHPAILSVPSSLFYHDTLIPEALFPSNPLQSLSLWRGRRWPVLFIPRTGADEIERDGAGWYNLSEARIACDTAQRLIVEGQVEQRDICIMSPFAAQVKVLRALIRSKKYGNGNGLWHVNIGPLEAFQGLENRAVIICTTRTRARFLNIDEEAGFGIVRQERRMNVALTRAKEALFVIGNPAVLGEDDNWCTWMAFVLRNGLVLDEKGLWSGEQGNSLPSKIGVLERSLIARDTQINEMNGPALGAAAVSAGISHDADYERWIESLRTTLDEEEEEQEDGDKATHGVV